MQTITSAKFKHIIAILRNVIEDELAPEQWIVLYETFAEIKPLSEQNVGEIDSIQFGHILTEQYFIISIRYLPNITDKLRIKFQDRTFAIKRIINPFEKNKFLKIITLEISKKQ